MSLRMPCTHEPWVLWPAKNCTMCFMTPQKSHFLATKMKKLYSLKCMCPWTVGFTYRKNRIFRSQKWRKSTLSEVPLNSGLHDSAKIAFSCSQDAENELTRKHVPLNRLFNDSRRNSFFRPSKCRKWAWTVDITIRQKSHIKVTKKQKMSSHEARYPGNVGFRTRQKLHFQC